MLSVSDREEYNMEVCEVCMGRPTDSTARLVKEMRVYDLLDRLDIRYRRVDHPAAMTMDDCTAADTALGVLM